jgi:glycerol 2-dehydrogenase (NADP+)
VDSSITAVAKHVIVLPKSVTPSRIAGNLTGAIEASTKLTDDDLARLDGVAASGKQKRCVIS